MMAYEVAKAAACNGAWLPFFVGAEATVQNLKRAVATLGGNRAGTWWW